MHSALLDIGASCAAPACRTHDFLPARCPACTQSFCADHILADRHACPEPPLPPPAQHDKLTRCALQQCSKPSLDAYSAPGTVACPACHKSYCPEHRHPTSHICTPASPAAEPVTNTKARALLAKVSASSASTPRTSAKRAAKPPTDPAKLAAFQKIQRMKMRHNAVPLDPKDKTLSPPLDQRLHIEVRYGEMTKVFWLRKTLIAGKALDLICGQFDIGQQSDSVPRRLSMAGSDAQLRNDAPLSEQVDDGSTLSLL